MITKHKPDNVLLDIGDIFAVDDYDSLGVKLSTTNWKVVGYYNDGGNSGWPMDIRGNRYSVVKCNKNGKEYKDTNGFATSIDNNLKKGVSVTNNRYRIVRQGTNDAGSNKADILEGVRVGRLKRMYGNRLRDIDRAVDRANLIRAELGMSQILTLDMEEKWGL